MKILIIPCLVVFLSTPLFCQTIFTFNGNGKWSDSSNWLNRKIPPAVLDSGSQIIIAPIASGECLLDTLQFLSPSSTITVQAGKKFSVGSDLSLNPILNRMGCLPSNPDSLRSVEIVDTAILARLNKRLPSAYALEVPTLADLPPIENQGNQSSCVAFATAYATRSYYLHKDHCTSYAKDGAPDRTKVLSPAYIYNQRANNSVDAGMSLFDALSLMKTKGVCTWLKMPYQDNDFSTLPSNSIDKNALIYKLESFKRVNTISQNIIKRLVLSGDLLMIAATIDYPFSISGKYTWDSKLNPFGLLTLGNHAMVICGWDDAKHAYQVMNSYGTAWGFKGFGWIDYDYLKQVVVKTGDRSIDEGDWEIFVMKTAPDFDVNFRMDHQTVFQENSIAFQEFTEPEPLSISWSFPGGDPLSSSSKNPTVRYDLPGTYKASLTVTNCQSYSETKDTLITVLDKAANSFTDLRDGQKYRFKQIGSQIWMTQNLNYAAAGSSCYQGDQTKCTTYGRLYDWNTALTVAPSGWHLPTEVEWQTLFTYLGGESIAGNAMKDTILWRTNNNFATNSSGFSALPAGYSGNSVFAYLSEAGSFWSATYAFEQRAVSWTLLWRNSNVAKWLAPQPTLQSVRCIKD